MRDLFNVFLCQFKLSQEAIKLNSIQATKTLLKFSSLLCSFPLNSSYFHLHGFINFVREMKSLLKKCFLRSEIFNQMLTCWNDEIFIPKIWKVVILMSSYKLNVKLFWKTYFKFLSSLEQFSDILFLDIFKFQGLGCKKYSHRWK